jgi:hypothetical protein
MLRHFAPAVHGEPIALRRVIASLEGGGIMETRARYRPFGGGYVSEFEQFMDSFMAGHPEVGRDQRRGWDIWWDHRVDLDALDKQRADTVADKPYHYE